ncbi:hypothetical protein [Nonomuraea africana]|uniref:Secreted protein n=1 Tax=Nonomuraea africana TaxID=46171 RepID=A0ABR9KQ41_9ACTN|nr:hypothetical protein [Nonomuraea africana]MBE1563880.1 hypothetical protein [Nonomuraea africana]
MPFISQPSTMMVSGAFAATSFCASRSKIVSKAPWAPADSSTETVLSGRSPSFGVIMGTFSARIRPGLAARQLVQGSRMKPGPWSAAQFSPGR